MPDVISLSALRPGQRSTIVYVGGNRALRRRYLEMGLVKGETILVERVAPLGDPIAYGVKGYCLSLRRSEAEQIFVTRLGDSDG